MPRPDWKTHGALAVVQCAFASQAVEGKLVMGTYGVDPRALAMTRMLGAAVFFIIFVRAIRALTPTTWRDRAILAGLSLLGVSVNQTLFLIGLRQTSSTGAALLSVTIPVFTAALAVVMRVERLTRALAVGLGLAVVGVLWLTGVRSLDRGAAIVTANSVCYSAYLVLSRGVIRRLGAPTVVMWVFVLGALTFLPIGLPALLTNAPRWNAPACGIVLFIVLVPTILAYLCNAWALGRTTPSLVTIYVSIQPVLAAVLAWVQLGQPLADRVLGAGAFILAGVALVVTRGTGYPRTG